MINKIKAIFAAIGSIGVLMFVVSAFIWLLTNYPALTPLSIVIFWFSYCGYQAYMYFLVRFKKDRNNKQINS